MAVTVVGGREDVGSRYRMDRFSANLQAGYHDSTIISRSYSPYGDMKIRRRACLVYDPMTHVSEMVIYWTTVQ